MPRVRASAAVLCIAFLAGCAGSYQVVQMPQREADLYPLAQTQAGVTIAIDAIKDTARVERYFGANLIAGRILPVAVLVSNHGKNRVNVKASDILLHRGRDIIDPLPVEVVVAYAKSQRWFLRSKTEEEIEKFFENLSFSETALPPDETYQAVMFFPIPEPRNDRDTFFTVLNLFREGGPKIRMGVTDLDTRERLHFGPFSIALPEDETSYSSAYWP